MLLLVARNFDTNTYGGIVTLMTLTAVFVTIFDFGLPIFLQREISINGSGKSEIFSSVFSISLLLFAAYITFTTSYFKIFYSDISTLLFFTIAVMMYISSLVTLCNKTLSGVNEFKSQFITFTAPRLIIIAVFTCGIYYFSFSIESLMAAMLGGFVLNLILVLIRLKKSGIIFSARFFPFKHTRSILKISIPLGLAVIFNMVYDKIDVLLISKLRDFTEVAFYNVGYGLYKTGALSFSFLLVPGFTKVASMNKDKKEIDFFFRRYFKIIAGVCIVTGILLFFLAVPAINLIYSEKFSTSASVLKILSFGLVALGLNNLTGIIINAMGYFKVVMYITLYALILNTVLNAVFIPIHGIIAASVITVITEYFIFFTEYYYLRKIMNTL